MTDPSLKCTCKNFDKNRRTNTYLSDFFTRGFTAIFHCLLKQFPDGYVTSDYWGPVKGICLIFCYTSSMRQLQFLFILYYIKIKSLYPLSIKLGGGGHHVYLCLALRPFVCGKNGFGLITLLILNLQCWYFIHVVSMHWGGHFLIFGSKGQGHIRSWALHHFFAIIMACFDVYIVHL